MTCPNDTAARPNGNLLLRIVLPFPLPTWNALLTAHPWRRRAIRKWIHRAVSVCSAIDTDSLTLMESAQRLSSTGLSLPEYLRMIRPNRLSKARLSRKSRSAGQSRNKR